MIGTLSAKSAAAAGADVDPELIDQVFCRLVGVAILPATSNAWLAPNGLPKGFAAGPVGTVSDVSGGFATIASPSRTARHRIAVSENDIAYIGYIHNWDGNTVTVTRDDGTRRIYGYLPSWITDDPFPS